MKRTVVTAILYVILSVALVGNVARAVKDEPFWAISMFAWCLCALMIVHERVLTDSRGKNE